MNGRTQASLIAVLLGTAALAGCMGDDGEETDDTTTSSGPPTDTGNQTTGWRVTILTYTDMANVTEDIIVDWSVSNEDGRNTTIAMTAVHYGNRSVPSPTSIADYGNVSGEQTATSPGNFTANFTHDQPDTLYLRAYASIEGVDYWSDEVSIEVGGAGAGAAEVSMRSAAIGYLSGFDPEAITVNVGDAIVWVNDDDERHTATSQEGGFDTGQVDGGAESEPIVFSEAGEFSYVCSNHPQTMTGTITVQ